MRSSPLLALALGFAACAKPDQIKQCAPIASWATPVFRCAAPAEPPPPPVVVEEPPPPPPEPEPPKVEVKDEQIELKEKVQFEFAKATLLPEGKTLLDEVARVMTEHPEILKVRIEGHTDSKGSKRSNLRLSGKRAKAVRSYLISKGIAKGRMVSKGYGESKPIADNGTPDGREQNRRVEIHILERK